MQTVVALPGITLFHIASEYLGDATQWSRIALINEIRDPFVITLMSLSVPTTQAQHDPRNVT
jgi:nucleoid-associated protein YgaU